MSGVCVVIVTYGNRVHLLKQVMNSCIKNNVSKIIVIDNASQEESASKLSEFSMANPDKVSVFRMSRNLGSAGGFKRGIEEALKYRECEYILLLDDDNVMLENCTNVLLYNFNRLEPIYGKDNLVLSAYRVSLNQLSHRAIKRGVFKEVFS